MGLLGGLFGEAASKVFGSSSSSSGSSGSYSSSSFPANRVTSQPQIPREIQREINTKTNKFIKEHVSEKLGNTLEKIDEVAEIIGPRDPRERMDEASKHVAGLIINLVLTQIDKILPGKTPKEIKESCEKGDHLYVSRKAYTHHALYVGYGNVLHYSDGRIHECSLETFADDAEIHQIITPSKYSRDEIVKRGYSRYGEDKYNVAFNNCQQFVEWCRNGD